MSVIFLLLGASITVAAGFLIAYLWAVRDGQYDDTYTPSVRMLFDDEESPEEDAAKMTTDEQTKENQSENKK